MGFICGLYFLANVMWGGVYHRVVRKQKKLALKNQDNETENEGNGQAKGYANISIAKKKDNAEKESTI